MGPDAGEELSGTKELPWSGGLGGASGVAEEAGAGLDVGSGPPSDVGGNSEEGAGAGVVDDGGGTGATTGVEDGAGRDGAIDGVGGVVDADAGVEDGAGGDGAIDGVGGGVVDADAGVEDGAGGDGAIDGVGNFSGAKSGGSEASPLGLGVVLEGLFVDGSWKYGGIRSPGDEVPIAALLAAAGEDGGPFLEGVNAGAEGAGGAAASLAGGSGGLIAVVSMALAGRISGDADLFAGGSFFTPREDGDTVFAPFAGCAGGVLDLLPLEPVEDLPHSSTPITGGMVGLDSAGVDGEDGVSVGGLVFSWERFSFLDGRFSSTSLAAGLLSFFGGSTVLAAGEGGFEGGSLGMFGSDISFSSSEIGIFASGSGAAGTGSAAATVGDSAGVCSCILSPITAPVRHRNVQVMAIPILCSSFMRVLLCSDEMFSSEPCPGERQKQPFLRARLGWFHSERPTLFSCVYARQRAVSQTSK